MAARCVLSVHAKVVLVGAVFGAIIFGCHSEMTGGQREDGPSGSFMTYREGQRLVGCVYWDASEAIWGAHTEPARVLAYAIWEDGVVIWSADFQAQNAQFLVPKDWRTAVFSTREKDALLGRVKSSIGGGAARAFYASPESTCGVIRFEFEGAHVSVRTDHIFVDHGSAPASAEARDAVRFWTDITAILRDSLPASADQVDLSIPAMERIVSEVVE